MSSGSCPNFKENKLIRIQYPGIVANVENVIKTLGGMEQIEFALGENNKKLQLRFRPDDKFSKVCVADKDFNPGILLKVKYKQRKVLDTPLQTSSSTDFFRPDLKILDYSVVGVTPVNFIFNRMCDFQLLPLQRNEEEVHSPMEYVYEKIIPNQLPALPWLLCKEAETMPYFFIPPAFSRFDKTPQVLESYENSSRPQLGDKLRTKSLMKQNADDTKSARVRKSRKGCGSIFLKFDAADVPSQPSEVMSNKLITKAIRGLPIDKIVKLFEERPIWSKAGLCHKSGISSDDMKDILPALAYYCPFGPWRVMWVKFGYDPRKDPSSRIYQTFDFRIRTVGMKVRIQAKRSSSSYARPGVKVKKISLKGVLSKSKQREVPGESSYILKPGITPPARQMFYQYCDIYLPEIDRMLSRLPDVPTQETCNKKYGWLPPKFHEQCREIANRYIVAQIKSEIEAENNQDIATNVVDSASITKPSDVEQLKVVNNNDETIIILDDIEEGINLAAQAATDDQENLASEEGYRDNWTDDDRDETLSCDDSVTDGKLDTISVDDLSEEGEIDLEIVEEINKLLGTIQETSIMKKEENK